MQYCGVSKAVDTEVVTTLQEGAEGGLVGSRRGMGRPGKSAEEALQATLKAEAAEHRAKTAEIERKLKEMQREQRRADNEVAEAAKCGVSSEEGLSISAVRVLLEAAGLSIRGSEMELRAKLRRLQQHHGEDASPIKVEWMRHWDNLLAQTL